LTVLNSPSTNVFRKIPNEIVVIRADSFHKAYQRLVDVMDVGKNWAGAGRLALAADRIR